MELLLRLAREVAASDTLDGMLHAIVEMSTHETGAERGSLFLYDDQTKELYSRVAQGTQSRELRFSSTSGIAGDVFTTGRGTVVHDAYADPRFNQNIDQETNFITRNMVCAPVRTVKGNTIGVLQVLNKRKGRFSEKDLKLLEAMTTQTAVALHGTQFRERMLAARKQELRFLELVADITSDIDLSSMLSKVVGEAARMLDADRATLFLNDEKNGELFSRVAMGDSVGEIRMSNHVGIAGAVFTSGKTINIPHAYADLRFNPAFDKRTGYFTRSILCVPITNKAGKVIGVTQVLNKKGGPFTGDDEARLRAFTAQLAIGLENAKLFDDVQNIKNYNESMLESMSNGVITLNEEARIVTCNSAGLRILRTSPAEILNRSARDYFGGENAWVIDKIKAVESTQKPAITMDATLVAGGQNVSANVTVLPLVSTEDGGRQKKLGSLLMVEDISNEKRMKSTMSRYMDPAIADQLLAAGGEALGGRSVTTTVLFSDIRSFTTISEEIGPHETVHLLNDYFSIMVECIQRQGGMLDKFIGDAIMAVFGLPVSHGDDEDRAVRAAVSMITELRRWNGERAALGLKPIEMGIGLNTDDVVSGNIGSPKRMDYTIIGDGVNLASRLEGACKQYGARILITENTMARLRGTYRLREVDRVVVKGKTEPVAIFEVLDYHTDESFPNLLDAVHYFKGGLGFYRKGEWDRAIAAFREASALNPADLLPPIYLERCEHLKSHPPGEGWNGVWVMRSK
jgi:adenylate cyclase